MQRAVEGFRVAIGTVLGLIALLAGYLSVMIVIAYVGCLLDHNGLPLWHGNSATPSSTAAMGYVVALIGIVCYAGCCWTLRTPPIKPGSRATRWFRQGGRYDRYDEIERDVLARLESEEVERDYF